LINAASKLYEALALDPKFGIHPAFSLELLTGAYIESRRFEKAEPLESALLDIRMHTVGANNELVPAMYANMGDFNFKWSRLDQAEQNYRRSIDLTKHLNLPQGWGSPMTKLATLLRNEKRFAESEAAYKEALAIRTERFGANSEKAAETLREYSQLLKVEGHNTEAAALAHRAQVANGNADPVVNGANGLSIFLLVGSLLFFWKRDRLLLWVADVLQKRKTPSTLSKDHSSSSLIITGLIGCSSLLRGTLHQEI